MKTIHIIDNTFTGSIWNRLLQLLRLVSMGTKEYDIHLPHLNEEMEVYK